MIKKFILALGLLLVVAAVGLAWITRPIAVTHAGLAQAELPAIIPLREFYADRNSRWRYQLSPDGKYLSWLESKWFKPALWVKPLDGEEAEIFHTDDEVRWYSWSSDSRYLIYQADRDGWENDVLVSIDTKYPGAEPRSYEFGRDVKTWLYQVPLDSGSQIVIAHNGRDRSQRDLYKLDLDSGETTSMDQSIEEGVRWHLTRKGEIFARTRNVTGADWRFELREGDNWRELVRGTFEDIFSTLSAPNDDGYFYALSNLGRDKSAFVKVSASDGKEQILDKHDSVDYGGVILDIDTGKPLMGISNPGYQERQFFDTEFKALVDGLEVPKNAAVHVVSATRDKSKLLVTIQEAEAGFETKLIERETGKVTSIAKPGIAAHRDKISPVKPVFIEAEDGLTIPAFLSVPKGVKGPAPMVIIIHGGPTVRSYWGWSGGRAWMNNRGYAVLDVNYRASWGYGRKFREAAIGEVSRKMDQDITDARKWAIDEGIADPEKVAVFGGSFGGLKVLTAMTRNPDLYAAGIDINGLSDISSMLLEVPVYWRGWPDWYRKYIGDPSDPEVLKDILDRSPFTHADKLVKPLMIIQGTNDVRVIRDQADKMVNALKQNNIPHEYILLKGAGHQFRNWGWKRRIITFRKMERFLAKHLGGRADGFDYAETGAHILNSVGY